METRPQDLGAQRCQSLATCTGAFGIGREIGVIGKIGGKEWTDSTVSKHYLITRECR